MGDIIKIKGLVGHCQLCNNFMNTRSLPFFFSFFFYDGFW
jgi:hypothetical protein